MGTDFFEIIFHILLMGCHFPAQHSCGTICNKQSLQRIPIMCKNKFTCSLRMDGCRAIHEETYMMILLFSVLNDEQRALVERIFHEHHIHFQRISFNIVKSEENAEDVVSTAFIKIMDNIEKISDLPGPQMTAFCVTIVKNASIDVLRQLQQSVHIDYWDNISDEDTDDIEDECIHNADVYRLTEVIDQLNPDDRHFIYLRYTLEMGYREIGELLNISEDAAKKRGQRLIKKLQKLYEER